MNRIVQFHPGQFPRMRYVVKPWTTRTKYRFRQHIWSDSIQVITQVWVLLLAGLGLAGLLDVWVSNVLIPGMFSISTITSRLLLILSTYLCRQGMTFPLFSTLLLVGLWSRTFILLRLWRYCLFVSPPLSEATFMYHIIFFLQRSYCAKVNWVNFAAEAKWMDRKFCFGRKLHKLALVELLLCFLCDFIALYWFEL